MKNYLLRSTLVAAAAALGLSVSVRAQIAVGLSGSSTSTFDGTATIPVAEWATSGGLGSGAGAYTSAAAVETAVQTLDQSSLATTLPNITANGTSANARHNTAAGYLVTQPTSVGAAVLKATLRNTSGQPISSITVAYDFGVAVTTTSEDTFGQEVFYSTNGAPNTWVRIPEFSSLNAAAALTATLDVGVWLPNQNIYLLWADDNGQTNPDGAYTIDNFRVTSVVTTNVAVPLTATLTGPTNGSLFAGPLLVTLTADSVGTPAPTSVSFYTNNVLAGTATAFPYSTTVVLPVGTHTIYAVAANGVNTAFSQTNTVTVRDAFMHFSGVQIGETFDSMGPAGTLTPLGWYVGSNANLSYMTVNVSDGNHRPQAGVSGLNEGTSGDGDRALAVQATGSDRSMVVRIMNDTAGSLTSVTFHYDGEVWRPYTNAQFSLTNEYSLDQGATWIISGTTFDFQQPFPIADPPGSVAPTGINGNDPANRTAGIGGTITLPTPVPPNGSIYIRWFDFNDGGDDGVMAVDNFTFTATVQAFTPTVEITAPTNGAIFSFLSPFTITAIPSLAHPVTNVTVFDNNLTTVIGSVTNAPFSVVASNLSVGTHTLRAIAQDNTGVRATNAITVTITINPNVPPSVTITNPVSGSEYFVGTMVTNVSASASDSDGSIVRVEFFLDGVLWATDTTSAYSFDLCDITAGTHTIAAVAVDNASGRTTNSISITATNPPGITTIITNGSDWKYLDNGSDQGTAWHDLGFDDSTWASGNGELGYGDAPVRPERTTVSFGPNSNAKYATTYFRKKFNVANPAAFNNLLLRILKDDHAIVYLNGTQVFSDMTNAVVTYQTFENPAIAHDGVLYEETNVLNGILVAGQNIIAVEVHQDSATSSDLSFDLMLWDLSAGPSGPRLTLSRPDDTHMTISWDASAAGYRLQSNTDLGNPGGWIDVQTGITGAGSLTVATTGGPKFYRLRNP